MEIRQICMNGTEVVSDVTAESNTDDYEIIGRVWVRNDGEPIREWTAEEYINCNPNRMKIMPVKIGNMTLKMEAHCQELRRQIARNKNGVKLFSFITVFDYQKQTK